MGAHVITATAAVDINIVCHLISAGKREPTIGAYVTLGFLISIPSPPVTAYRVINFSGPKYFNNGCRHLSSYQQSMSRSAGVAPPENGKNNVFGRRDCDLDLRRPLFDDIDAEINDREC
jgi:hypothetical protein